jgi:hypothetical protein
MKTDFDPLKATPESRRMDLGTKTESFFFSKWVYIGETAGVGCMKETVCFFSSI